MVSRIVVGHDGSRHSAAAVREALVLGRALRLPVRIVKAFSMKEVGFSEGHLTVDPMDQVEARQNAALADELAELTAEFAEVAVEFRAVHGNPEPVLLRESEDARLLVIGSRGLGGLSRLLGSVSERLVAHAKTTVVVVHRDTQA